MGSWNAQNLGRDVAADKEERKDKPRLITIPLAESVKVKGKKQSRNPIQQNLFPAVVAELLRTTMSVARLYLVQHLGLCSRFG